MSSLRQWHLEASSPYALQIAADARLQQTDYTNDQSWELTLGTGDAPALALQTRYGGRVGLTSIVPMWVQNGRTIVQAQTYARLPIVTAFAPGYLRAEGALTPTLHLKAEYMVVDSQATAGCFTVSNTGGQPETIRLDLFGHVAAQNKQLPLAIITLVDQTHALSLGRLRGLEPVVVMQDATVEIVPGRKASPKIGVDLSLNPGEQRRVRWVHAGLNKMNSSLEHAQFWLRQGWDEQLKRIEEAAQAIPIIDTGDVDIDAAIAFSYQQLAQAFIGPTEHLPYASFVAARQPSHGFSPRGDGSDYDRSWSGQSAHLAYLIGTAAASIAPHLAQGIIHNYLAVQEENGTIDARPGLGGQKLGLLSPPILCRLAWEIYQYTEDIAFLAEVFPGLIQFFNRWSESDLDVDSNMLPEWQDERQTGYVFWPTFGEGQPWAQNLNIRLVETPDTAAYLISEAESLRKIGETLGQSAAYEFDSRAKTLLRSLSMLWDTDLNRFAYRDRDTLTTPRRMTILDNVQADEEHLPALKLETPARVIVQVSGGTGKVPRATLHLQGEDSSGSRIDETVQLEQFAWSYGHGFYTSEYIYAIVDRVRIEGLSRVYRLNVHTVDLTRLDVNAVMPLIAQSLSEQNAAVLAELVADETWFMRPGGLTIVSTQDEDYDPSSANGGGGVWPYWLTLIGEGLIAHGYVKEAAKLLMRILKNQVETLKKRNRFSEFYHAEEFQGLGEDGHVGGIVPLHLLMCVLGVRIVNSGRVWVGGEFHWPHPVTIMQHGVTVMRTEGETRVEFASGNIETISSSRDWQAVVDPAPVKLEMISSGLLIEPPNRSSASQSDRVIIAVNLDDS